MIWASCSPLRCQFSPSKRGHHPLAESWGHFALTPGSFSESSSRSLAKEAVGFPDHSHGTAPPLKPPLPETGLLRGGRRDLPSHLQCLLKIKIKPAVASSKSCSEQKCHGASELKALVWHVCLFLRRTLSSLFPPPTSLLFSVSFSF